MKNKEYFLKCIKRRKFKQNATTFTNRYNNSYIMEIISFTRKKYFSSEMCYLEKF